MAQLICINFYQFHYEMFPHKHQVLHLGNHIWIQTTHTKKTCLSIWLQRCLQEVFSSASPFKRPLKKDSMPPVATGWSYLSKKHVALPFVNFFQHHLHKDLLCYVPRPLQPANTSALVLSPLKMQMADMLRTAGSNSKHLFSIAWHFARFYNVPTKTSQDGYLIQFLLNISTGIVLLLLKHTRDNIFLTLYILATFPSWDALERTQNLAGTRRLSQGWASWYFLTSLLG